MKKAVKMMLLSESRKNKHNDYYPGYYPEMEDRYGRRHPMNESDMWVESRFMDRDGREHYDNGRYAPSNYYNEKIHGEYMPYHEDVPYRTNRIGFALSGTNQEGNIKSPNEFEDDYKIPEMEHRKGDNYMMGHGSSESYMPFNKSMAEEWTRKMENEDGTKGPHWTMEQTKQVMAQKGIDCDPVEFFTAINMMYSDYCKVAKKLGFNSLDFYAEMAKAFLDDKDAGPDKLSNYYHYVVK